MQPSGNLVADTICRTAEIGLTITGAADAGNITIIDTTPVAPGLEELAQLGRTFWRRREDVLAYFDVGASNGPVEAINGRLEHLRGIALGLRTMDHYILRCLIHSGQLQGKINAL